MPLTDSKEFTVAMSVPPPPDLKIEDLTYPASAKPGESVTISWMVHNAGGTSYVGDQWTRLIDLDTKETLYSGLTALDTCERAGPATVTKAMPSRNWRLRAEAGYAQTTTDSKEFTVAAVVPPNVKIENLSYPSSAKPGDTITISWSACNRGGDTAYSEWTRLIDKDTGSELYRKDFTAAGGACVSNSKALTMPNKNYNLRIEAGYGSTATASAEFTVGLPGIPAEIPLVPMAVGAAVGGVIGYVAKPGALGTLVGAGLGTAAGYALSTLGLGQGVSLGKAPSLVSRELFRGGIAAERAPPPPRISGALA
jgi:hypothetical protein